MAKLTPLKNGKSQVAWTDRMGVRHRKRLAKKAAQDLYDAVCAEKFFDISGISAVHQPKSSAKQMTFAELAKRYVDEHLIPFTRAQSNVYYLQILVEKWGKYRLPMLSAAAFKKWIRYALTNPIRTPKGKEWKLTQLAPASVKKLVRYFTRTHYWAMQEGILAANPFANLIPKKDPIQKEFRRQSKFKAIVLTVEEFWPLASSFPSFVRNPSVACFFSGIRRGELSQIRWSKINRKDHCIEYEADETKEADEKKVYYDPEFEIMLEALEIEYLTQGYNDDVVFRNTVGRPLTDDSFTHSVRYYADLYAEKSGVEKYKKVSPHTFRRSYRTRKDREGGDRKAVARNMGHHSDITSDGYNYVEDDRQRAVAGFATDIDPEVQELIEKAMDAARLKGILLSEIQSVLRRQWKLTEKNAPNDR